MTRVPPGPEYSWLRFQRYQWDPSIPRPGAGRTLYSMDLDAGQALGYGKKRSWDPEEDVTK